MGHLNDNIIISHSKIEFVLHPLVSFVMVLRAGIIRGRVATLLQVFDLDVLAAVMTSTAVMASAALLPVDHIVHDKDH